MAVQFHIMKEFLQGPMIERKGYAYWANKLHDRIQAVGGRRVKGCTDYDLIFSRVYEFSDEDAPIAKQLITESDWSVEVIDWTESSELFKDLRDIKKAEKEHDACYDLRKAIVTLDFCHRMAVKYTFHHWHIADVKIYKMGNKWYGIYRKDHRGWNRPNHYRFTLVGEIWIKVEDK